MRKAAPSVHPDSAFEEAEVRHQALLDVIESLREVGSARVRLGKAEDGLRLAIARAVGTGINQAEIARTLGWSRQRVHALLVVAAVR